MIRIAAVLDLGSDFKTIQGHHRGVGRLLRPSTGLRLMLTNKIQQRVAVGVAPQPPLGAIEPSTILIPTGMAPEGHRQLIAVDPLPAAAIAAISHRSHPVLGADIAAMTPPQLPADEALQRRIALADQSAAARAAEGERVQEVQRLAVVEDVALAIVGGQGTRWLVPERGTTLDGQSLVGVHEGLANGQRIWGAVFEVNADKGAGHGRIAGQKQRLTGLQETREAIADGICAQIGTIVAHADHYGGRFVACVK